MMMMMMMMSGVNVVDGCTAQKIRRGKFSSVPLSVAHFSNTAIIARTTGRFGRKRNYRVRSGREIGLIVRTITAVHGKGPPLGILFFKWTDNFHLTRYLPLAPRMRLLEKKEEG